MWKNSKEPKTYHCELLLWYSPVFSLYSSLVGIASWICNSHHTLPLRLLVWVVCRNIARSFCTLSNRRCWAPESRVVHVVKCVRHLCPPTGTVTASSAPVPQVWAIAVALWVVATRAPGAAIMVLHLSQQRGLVPCSPTSYYDADSRGKKFEGLKIWSFSLNLVQWYCPLLLSEYTFMKGWWIYIWRLKSFACASFNWSMAFPWLILSFCLNLYRLPLGGYEAVHFPRLFSYWPLWGTSQNVSSFNCVFCDKVVSMEMIWLTTHIT